MTPFKSRRLPNQWRVFVSVMILLVLSILLGGCNFLYEIPGTYIREGTTGGGLKVEKTGLFTYSFTPMQETGGRITGELADPVETRMKPGKKFYFEIEFPNDGKPFTIVFELEWDEFRLTGMEYYKDTPARRRRVGYRREDKINSATSPEYGS